MTQAVPLKKGVKKGKPQAPWDAALIACVTFIVGLGLVMVTSASMPIADREMGEPLYYFWRQLGAGSLALVLVLIVTRVPLLFWQRTSVFLALSAVLLLGLVLLPGLGKEVNGSQRWIALGPIALQASEPAKLAAIVYLAGYLAQRHEGGLSFLKPLILLALMGVLLLLEPDYGACAVLFGTVLSMSYLAGVSLARFAVWGILGASALAAIAVLTPYRLQRLMSFMDPWADPYNSGFQLTQALIAFGRGEWLGVGLGNSVQKLFYLPEVHTDFIFAVVAEELGLLGSGAVIGLFTFITCRALLIGINAERTGRAFGAYLAHGVGVLVGLQAFINMGVNMGVLPTKGLTLPLVSYGSNSLIVTGVAIALLLRVDHETRARTHSGFAAQPCHASA
ncbi:MAG: putative lipid II flippase FtsW [Gammaproteobacteria bacterium]